MPDPTPAGHGPIEPRRLLADPAPDRIERAAVWNLARALNIGRVIAFIGAGVPMAYGRISWRGLVEMLADQVEQDCQNFVDAGRGNDTERARISDLRKRVKTMRAENAGPDQYPTLFQLAELLDDTLAEVEKRPQGRLRRTLAVNIFDDRGQGKELFRRAFASPGKAPEPGLDEFMAKWFGEDANFETRRTSLDTPDDNSPEYAYRRLFTADRIRSLVSTARRAYRTHKPDILPLVNALAKAASAGDPKGHASIIPTHRFAVTALLRLIITSARPLRRAIVIRQTKPAAGRARVRSRTDRFPTSHDPLLILFERLRIDRFLTTNYDLDIERLFRDLGFVTEPKAGGQTAINPFPSSPRTDRLEPLGGRSRDLVLNSQGHGRLIDFATQDRRGRPQLVHLHGRATLDDGDKVVVTEQDYQGLYQRAGIDRHPMDVARSVTFGGNPLLFVGLGMGEDDILRPLRQFMGQESRLGDRLAVAIMPGTKRSGARLLEQMTLLNRYGVYGIYYGSAHVPSDTADGKPGNQISDWLAWMLELADAIIKFVKAEAGDIAHETEALAQKWREAHDAKIVARDKILAPVALDGVAPSQANRQLEFEIDLLQACVDLARAGGSLPEPVRATLEIVAEGVKNALQSSCLCARLMRLEAEWGEWKDDWFRLPEPRDVDIHPLSEFASGSGADTGEQRAKAPSTGGSIGWLTEDAQVYGRHVVDLPDLPKAGGPAPADRFYIDPPSRALHVLRGGLRHKSPGFWDLYRGRRLFLLLSRPGVGKGHVFTSLAGREGLPRFLAATWGQMVETDPPSARYAGAAFYNLSFSHEVASVFDRLTGFLEESWVKAFPCCKSDPPIEERRKALQAAWTREKQQLINDRRGRLLNVINAYAAGARELPNLHHRVVIAINNASALYDPDGRPKNTGLHRLFNALVGDDNAAAPLDIVLLCSTRAVPPQFRNGHASQSGAMLRLLPLPCTQSHRITIIDHERLLGLRECVDVLPIPTGAGPAGITVCHLLRRAQVKTIAASFFPRVAMAMTAATLGAQYRDIPHDALLESQRTMRRHAAERRDDSEVDLATVLRLVRALWSWRKDEGANLSKWLNSLGNEAGTDPRFRRLSERTSEQFREFSFDISKDRFSTTLLLAAADEQIGPQDEGLREGEGSSAVRFLNEARLRLLGAAPALRGTVSVDIVLKAMERQHRDRLAPPIKLRKIHRLGPVLLRLLHQILWHIAIIGEPVEAHVLELCPDIKEVLDDLAGCAEEAGSSPDRKDPAADLMEDALDLLVHRCLIFVAARHLTDHRGRYGVHRLIQRMVFQLLEAPIGQQRALNRFSLSLYAAQPSDLPRPSLEAHGRLRRLAEHLSGYPETALDRLDPDRDQSNLWSRRLRAAFGVICSVYHVAIIGRFDDYGSQDALRPRELGYFESHRLLVRWLLRQSVNLDYVCKKNAFEVTRPFYAEEIVWLLNENGVLSLAQGRVNDATAMFDQALTAARQWLAPNDGALAARIGLNAALVDIERGSAHRARSTLVGILSYDDEDPVILGVAEGLIGLTDHLAGELKGAADKYVSAINKLLSVRSMRAASIFTRHLGDLVRARGPNHYREAREHLIAAETLARQGAHEDAAQLARLAHARLLVTEGQPVQLVEALREMDGIEDYARVVGLPRILAEVASIRAEAVLRQGETRRSMELAVQALELSTLHDLRLFKTRALAAVSRAFYRQGVTEAADLVRRRGEELARRSRYTSMAKVLSFPEREISPRSNADHGGD